MREDSLIGQRNNFEELRIIGMYRILGELGRGGMGIVYRARHIETGREVALKTIPGVNHRQLSSIRREVRALKRITHPGIARIIEEGIDKDRPWYAMELIQGISMDDYRDGVWKSLSERVDWTAASDKNIIPESSPRAGAAWWRKILGTTVDDETWREEIEKAMNTPIGVPKAAPEKRGIACGGHLEDVLALFYKISLSLAYLHGEGIVHRDLKPSNILIKRDGMPVLMDFGLMTEFKGAVSRDELSAFSEAGGTLLYTSPEQISGEVMDARADLYSLGCMMYEFITGQMPFHAESIAQIIQAHLRLLPIPPSQIVTGVPKQLDELVMNLLEKQPHNRIGHAHRVAAILQSLGIDTSLPMELPKPRAHLYRARFTGRDDIFHDILARVKKLETGEGGMVFIGGESGLGKTRILQEIWRRARRLHLRIFTGECTAKAGEKNKAPASFDILKPMFHAIYEICRDSDISFCRRVVGANGKILAPFFPELLRLPGLADFPDPPMLKQPAAQLRLFNAVAQLLKNLAADHPILILLDDLQWIDGLTCDFFMFLLRTGLLQKMSVLIIGTYRIEQASPALSRLLQDSHVNKAELKRLDIGSMRRIITERN